MKEFTKAVSKTYWFFQRKKKQSEPKQAQRRGRNIKKGKRSNSIQGSSSLTQAMVQVIQPPQTIMLSEFSVLSFGAAEAIVVGCIVNDCI
jgi:hypothetical protein